jgi:hypothetical protein
MTGVGPKATLGIAIENGCLRRDYRYSVEEANLIDEIQGKALVLQGQN